jgi:hypothetical protein
MLAQSSVLRINDVLKLGYMTGDVSAFPNSTFSNFTLGACTGHGENFYMLETGEQHKSSLSPFFFSPF